jgi:hypothetical protein
LSLLHPLLLLLLLLGTHEPESAAAAAATSDNPLDLAFGNLKNVSKLAAWQVSKNGLFAPFIIL